MLAIALLLGCRSDQSAKAEERNLSRFLDDPRKDTAAARADSQFQTCLYVYDSEEKLRECLVLRQKWSTEDAARRIAMYHADVARALDSVRVIKDSIEREEQRVRDSIRYAADLVRRQRWVEERAVDSVRLIAAFRPWVDCVRQARQSNIIITSAEMDEACKQRWPRSAGKEAYRRWTIYNRKDASDVDRWGP